MTLQHGTKPQNGPNKSPKKDDDDRERKRGVKPTLPPRDGTTRTEGVSKKHLIQDKNESQNSSQQGK